MRVCMYVFLCVRVWKPGSQQTGVSMGEASNLLQTPLSGDNAPAAATYNNLFATRYVGGVPSALRRLHVAQKCVPCVCEA